jgi:hypothetical protein
MPFFFFYKIREQEGVIGPALGFGTSKRWLKVGKEDGRINMCKYCTHVYK